MLQGKRQGHACSGNRQVRSDKPERSMTGARAQRSSMTAFPDLPDWPSWPRLACRHQTCRKRMLRGCPWIEAGLLAPNVLGGMARSQRQGKDITPSPQKTRKALNEQHGHARQTQAGQCSERGKVMLVARRKAKLCSVRQPRRRKLRCQADSQTVKQSDGPKGARQRVAEDGVRDVGSQSSCALQPLACLRLPMLSSKAQRWGQGTTGGASRKGHRATLSVRQATCVPLNPVVPSGELRRPFALPRDTPGWRCRAKCRREGESLASTLSRRDGTGQAERPDELAI